MRAPGDDDFGDGPRPFPMSLCHQCVHVRYTGNKRGSVFVQCAEPSLPKYGPQPVRLCARFVGAA